jgi:hypothetical protein
MVGKNKCHDDERSVTMGHELLRQAKRQKYQIIILPINLNYFIF